MTATQTKIFERKTSKGLLAIGLDTAGKLTMALDGREIFEDDGVRQLPAPATINGAVYTHVVGTGFALKADEAAAIAKARADYELTLRGQRNRLARALAGTDEESYPGSPAWRRYNAALTALREFDEAHPEVWAEIDGERRAAVAHIDPYSI